MLDRSAVTEFLDAEFEDLELELPGDIDGKALVEAFCQYVEDDYYEWLKDNFKSFLGDGEVDWDIVRERIARRVGL
ncbi:MAG: hypothetical protein SVP26_10815 [Chloroflexota bacterium]|nr:hypothetical protein [Chloroflexota bacterium]